MNSYNRNSKRDEFSLIKTIAFNSFVKLLGCGKAQRNIQPYWSFPLHAAGWEPNSTRPNAAAYFVCENKTSLAALGEGAPRLSLCTQSHGKSDLRTAMHFHVFGFLSFLSLHGSSKLVRWIILALSQTSFFGTVFAAPFCALMKFILFIWFSLHGIVVVYIMLCWQII